MIDGSEKHNRQLAFELQNSHVCEKCSNQLALMLFNGICLITHQSTWFPGSGAGASVN